MKLFRKTRGVLVQNNRVLKYCLYAVGEIILVVIGILIALQVNNWNIERTNTKQETNRDIWSLTDQVPSVSKEKAFANDRSNHVPSCGRVNSSKGSAVPKDFLRRSNDGKGLDYKIVRWCEYVTKYHSVKLAYQLTTSNNDQKLLASCSKSRSNTG